MQFGCHSTKAQCCLIAAYMWIKSFSTSASAFRTQACLISSAQLQPKLSSFYSNDELKIKASRVSEVPVSLLQAWPLIMVSFVGHTALRCLPSSPRHPTIQINLQPMFCLYFQPLSRSAPFLPIFWSCDRAAAAGSVCHQTLGAQPSSSACWANWCKMIVAVVLELCVCCVSSNGFWIPSCRYIAVDSAVSRKTGMHRSPCLLFLADTHSIPTVAAWWQRPIFF